MNNFAVELLVESQDGVEITKEVKTIFAHPFLCSPEGIDLQKGLVDDVYEKYLDDRHYSVVPDGIHKFIFFGEIEETSEEEESRIFLITKYKSECVFENGKWKY